MTRLPGRALAALLALWLGGCSSFSFFGLGGDEAKKPMPLTEIKAQVTPKVVWSVSVGKADGFHFRPMYDGARVLAAAADGTLTLIDADKGSVISRVDAGRKLSGGATGDGDVLYAGTMKGELVAIDTAGKEKWVARVGGEILAPMAIAGDRGIVRTADGRIFAISLFDGKRIWVYQRPMPPLLLHTATSVLVTATNVVAGYPGGKLIALDLDDGKLTWEVTVSVPHGSTELERVADVSGLPVIDGKRICAVAYQGKVACFDIQGGNAIWTREISSATGIAVDDKSVYLSDDQDNVHALDRDSGASRWKQDKLLRRRLTVPVVFEGRVVVGDSQGYLHVLSRDDGAIIGRLATDGTAINALEVTKVGLVVQTAGGTVALVRY